MPRSRRLHGRRLACLRTAGRARRRLLRRSLSGTASPRAEEWFPTEAAFAAVYGKDDRDAHDDGGDHGRGRAPGRARDRVRVSSSTEVASADCRAKCCRHTADAFWARSGVCSAAASRWMRPTVGLVTIDPSTTAPLVEFAEAGTRDVDRAVAAARAALEDARWRTCTPRPCAVLFRLADALEENLRNWRSLRRWTRGSRSRTPAVDVANAADHLRYFAGWTTKIEGATIPHARDRQLIYTRQEAEPVGVCADRLLELSAFCSRPGRSPRPLPAATRSSSSRQSRPP